MFDTHIHLDLLQNAHEQLAAAAAAGVTDVVGVGVDPRVFSGVQGTVTGNLRVHFALGFHPQALGSNEDDIQNAIVTLADRLGKESVVALGETGLDARAGMPPAALQEHAFRMQLRMAHEFRLPVVLHGVRRDAALLRIYDEEVAGGCVIRAVWHGFSGSRETMQEAIKRGMYISVGFMALQQKARRVREAIPSIPGDRLLVETDAPPLPPAKLVDVVGEVATLRGESFEHIATTTTQNARRFFSV